MASEYDDELWSLVPEDSSGPKAHLAAFIRGLGRADRVLDLGCGDGRLSREVSAGELVIADVSAVALGRATRRLPRARPVELAPDQRLPFADGSFDVVLCAETLEHVRDVQGVLSEVRRVLVPRGVLAISTPAHGRMTALRALVRGFESEVDPLSPHLRLFTARSLSAVLDATGFDVRELRTVKGSLLARATR